MTVVLGLITQGCLQSLARPVHSAHTERERLLLLPVDVALGHSAVLHFSWGQVTSQLAEGLMQQASPVVRAH